jgi:hypothetical protein
MKRYNEEDKARNLVSEEGEYRWGLYGYNGMDRMEYAEVRDVASGEVVISWYGYDGYGRRMVRGEAGRGEMRTVFDGLSFEVVREGVTWERAADDGGGAGGGVAGGK